VRQRAQEVLGCFQPSGGSADADYRERTREFFARHAGAAGQSVGGFCGALGVFLRMMRRQSKSA
ncbi:MAG: hypothetical protein L0312_26505, partial [Acidobacteria bacterium]|nr:hypothetical protein [Acidobacteriota bacterium]